MTRVASIKKRTLITTYRTVTDIDAGVDLDKVFTGHPKGAVILVDKVYSLFDARVFLPQATLVGPISFPFKAVFVKRIIIMRMMHGVRSCDTKAIVGDVCKNNVRSPRIACKGTI